MKTIYLAGGCFWGCEQFFLQFDGVLSTLVGYANGNTENPTYEDVKHRGSGHAETVKIDFDEEVISLTELLDDYFLVIDPLSVNRQGEDEGVQYRTGIYYDDESLLPEIRARVAKEAERLGQPLAVEVLPLENFYEAEEYHQKYLEKHPGGYCHIPGSMMHIAKGEG
ncbi:MAG: peptide-methionine (S)-S-oxide reductase MsrA [Clostridia bacterium]|nr:peptide-methionine (S)-S-oxide reductase MsrA [Clostridia bacterium]